MNWMTRPERSIPNGLDGLFGSAGRYELRPADQPTPRDLIVGGLYERIGLLTAAIGIQPAKLALKFRLEVLLASQRLKDLSGLAGVCGGGALPGTG
jgi:hypothetical protein